MANSSCSFGPVHHVLFHETFSSFGFQEAIFIFGFPPTHDHSFSFSFADSSSSPQPLNVRVSPGSVLGLTFSFGHTHPMGDLREAYIYIHWTPRFYLQYWPLPCLLCISTWRLAKPGFLRNQSLRQSSYMGILYLRSAIAGQKKRGEGN